MALSFTYTTLKQAILDWTEDDSQEFQDKLDQIIGLGEERIMRDLDLSVFRKTATTTTTASDKYITKPTDMVIDRAMRVTVNSVQTPVDVKDTSFIHDYNMSVTTAGTPRFYSDWDHQTFIVAPLPAGAYSVELDYTYKPDGLSSSTATTWIGTNLPNVLLFACLTEAIPFLKMPPDQWQTWEKKYADAVAAAGREQMGRQRHSEERTGEPRGGA